MLPKAAPKSVEQLLLALLAMAVDLLVEGFTDEIFVKRCFADIGLQVGTVYGKHGVDYVKNKAQAFSVFGQYSDMLILADFMDMNAACPPQARQMLVANIPAKALVRLAVNEIESWMMASRTELASYFNISAARIPAVPDQVVDPKQTLVNLARASNRGKIRRMFVPKPGISSVVGEGYVDGFQEFMASHWDLASARAASPSLATFVQRAQQVFTP
jgi:hypothetical protein